LDGIADGGTLTLVMHPAFAIFLALLTNVAADHSGFRLAGERIRFDSMLQPQFTNSQVKNTSDATRAGLSKFASTEYGQRLIRRFSTSEYEIVVTEDADESGTGRAPQPGIATLAAASDRSRLKTYDLILNPTTFHLPKGVTALPWHEPASAADVMAVAWAGEMLHIDFYSKGISLPHHQRPDFQDEWRILAEELGFPTLTHDDGDEGSLRPRRRVIVIRSRPR
jgi:hypothetical protein